MDNNPEEPSKFIQHNKHKKHPLKEVYKNLEFKCKICKLKSKGMRFQCHPCNFNVHTTCGTCPDSLLSFTHPQHTLKLKNKPFLSRKCDVCGNPFKGMVYRCESCKFFLHPLCTEFQEVLRNHPKHPPHSLKLQFNKKSSKCDVCEKSCKKFRYFCEICDVHIHVGCLSDDKIISGENHRFVKVLFEIISGIANGLGMVQN